MNIVELEEVEVVVQGGGVEVILQHDNVWTTEGFIQVFYWHWGQTPIYLAGTLRDF